MTFVYDPDTFSDKNNIIVSSHSKRLLTDVLSRGNELAHRNYISNDCDYIANCLQRDKFRVGNALDIVEEMDNTLDQKKRNQVKDGLKAALELIEREYRLLFHSYAEVYSAMSYKDFDFPF